MLIYRCIMCNRIFGLPSPSALSKCKWCGGRLVYVGKDYHPNASPAKKANEKKGNINYKGLWNFLKALGVVWGTGGTVNITRKSLKKEKIGKGDLFHTIFPWVAAGIIHCIQHPQGVKNLFAPSPPPRTQHNTNPSEVIIKGPTINLCRDKKIKHLIRR